jgi:class 3 adenylate cyclase
MPRSERRPGIELAARIGIATGPVIVGDEIGEGTASETAVVGETPNLAARLQALAQPNQIVVSAATRAMLGAPIPTDFARPSSFEAVPGVARRPIPRRPRSVGSGWAG